MHKVETFSIDTLLLSPLFGHLQQKLNFHMYNLTVFPLSLMYFVLLIASLTFYIAFTAGSETFAHITHSPFITNIYMLPVLTQDCTTISVTVHRPYVAPVTRTDTRLYNNQCHSTQTICCTRTSYS